MRVLSAAGRLRRWCCVRLVCVVVALSFSAPITSASQIIVADASTRVLFAEVRLTVSGLGIVEHLGLPTLVGQYEIRVPLRKAKNEWGKLYLPLGEGGSRILSQGGELTGWCDSMTFPGAQRLLYCKFTPTAGSEDKGQLDLHIDLGNRVVKFVSEYVSRVPRDME